ncbi:MAG TPA: glutamate--tRNA ligase, partial [Actinopolymorphaceae bacterium]
MTDRPRAVRTRFAPSPSGDLHVGNIRTALYAWAHARHTGGKFVFRIEDTDRSRVTPASIRSAIETLRWLGLDWNEGVEVGGPHGPYLQSERLDLYREWADRLLAERAAYLCYCTPEELEAEREEQRAKGRQPGYSGRCRDLTSQQIAAFEREDRKPVVRFRMPEGRTVVHDTIRGEVVWDNAHIPDFVIMRANGYPLYNLAVSVDDALMEITHIVRGDDLLSSTPKQIALYRAMGIAEDALPAFTHLPYVLGPDGKPLSKRYGSESISWYRDQGYLPEAVVNYLALLGWSPGDDREDLTLDELVELFDIDRVGATAARLDPKKLDAINGDKIRRLSHDDFVARMLPFLPGEPDDLSENPSATDRRALAEQVAPLVQERIVRLADVAPMVEFLFADDEEFAVDPEVAARELTEESRPVVEAALEALRDVEPWEHADIEHALRAALVDRLGRKPRRAF